MQRWRGEARVDRFGAIVRNEFRTRVFNFGRTKARPGTIKWGAREGRLSGANYLYGTIANNSYAFKNSLFSLSPSLSLSSSSENFRAIFELLSASVSPVYMGACICHVGRARHKCNARCTLNLTLYRHKSERKSHMKPYHARVKFSQEKPSPHGFPATESTEKESESAIIMFDFDKHEIPLLDLFCRAIQRPGMRQNSIGVGGLIILVYQDCEGDGWAILATEWTGLVEFHLHIRGSGKWITVWGGKYSLGGMRFIGSAFPAGATRGEITVTSFVPSAMVVKAAKSSDGICFIA